MTYGNWYSKANAVCVKATGLTLDDLPDGESYAAYEDGVSPTEYVRDLLSEEGFSL